MSNKVPPLNLTSEEKRTLIHCILAGQDQAIEHFGKEEGPRINSIKKKLNYPIRGDDK